MSYSQLRRLNFCYQLFTFLLIIGMGAFAIIAIGMSSILYGWITALFVLLTVGSIKRARMYQTKMDNFDYKYYLDNE